MEDQINSIYGDFPALPSEYIEPRWYAVHTCPRHEKRVREHFEERGIEAFLPTYPAVHRWKDRRVQLELPLFPGYVFVRVALNNRLRVVQVPSVLRFVGFGNTPAPIPNGELESLRGGLKDGVSAEPCPYLKLGDRVRIKSGPLQGAEGFLIRKKNAFRVVLSIDLIMQSVAVEVEIENVQAT